MESYPSGVRSRKIKNINGLTMHVLEAGYDNKETKPCVLLLHGFHCSPNLMNEISVVFLFLN